MGVQATTLGSVITKTCPREIDSRRPTSKIERQPKTAHQERTQKRRRNNQRNPSRRRKTTSIVQEHEQSTGSLLYASLKTHKSVQRQGDLTFKPISLSWPKSVATSNRSSWPCVTSNSRFQRETWLLAVSRSKLAQLANCQKSNKVS